MKNNINSRFLSFAQVREKTGLSRSSIHKAEKAGTFPKRRLLSECRVGWLESEIEEWIANRKPVSESVQPKHNIPPKKSRANKIREFDSDPKEAQEPKTEYKPISWWNRRDDDD